MRIGHSWINVVRTRKKSILAACMAMIISISGIPFIPGTGVQKAYASTSVRVTPNEVMTVYGGKMDISWNYTDPDEGQESHPTNVDICGRENLVSGADYPVIITNTVTWNGQIQGKPALDGSYEACVTPTDFNFPGASGFHVWNPAPPAPKSLEVLPNLGSSSHVIRGIAEIGTKIDLKMWVTKRVDNNRLFQVPELQPLAVNVPVTPGRSWSAGESIDGYFPQFPSYTDKTPSEFVGEWQIEVTLPEYEIAHITATAVRELDNKSSGPSDVLQVLRYSAPNWDVKWAELAGYYYNADSTESMSANIRNVASFNHVEIKTCSDGQNCPGFIDKGTNLLLMNPQAAGNILNADIADINKAYVNKYGHPIPEHLDPINLATGDFSFHHTNMSLQAAMPLSFTLTYRNRDGYNGMNGVGWHHSLDWHLSKSDGGNIVVVSPDGASVVYIPGADGQYLTPPGVFNTLVRQPDQTFVLETPQKWRYLFREDGLLHQIVDSNGNEATFVYQDTILQQVATEGASMNFTYGEGGKLSQLTDQSGRSVRYRYDAINHDLLAMVLPDGAEIGFEYDVKHRMTAIHNPNKTASLINVYDDQDRVIEQQDFSGEWSYVTYDPENRKTTTKDARGKYRTFTFDERYRQTEIAYPDGTTEAFTYDANDKMTSMKDRNGNTTTYIYDEKGNLLQQKDPTGAITNILYNEFNRPEQITDALGQTTRIGYDSKGNVTSVTNALNETVTVTVDGRGIPTSVQNANGETSVLTNDASGFARMITDPAGYSKELTRDALHRVTDVKDAFGNHTHMEYDPRDRVKTKVDALLQEEGFEYDNNSNLIRHTEPHAPGDANPAGTQYTYDKFDRLEAVTDALGQTTSFTYDEVGNRASMTDASGATSLYTYDDVNRLVEIKDPKGNVTKLTYDGNGNLLTMEDARHGETLITYDKRNLPLTVTDAEQGTTSYSYDALGRLIAETNALGQITQYVYDAAGKVIRLTDAAGQATAFEYDKAGRLIKQTKPNGAVWSMEYDARGLLTATVDPLGHRKELIRDDRGRVQIAKDEQGVKTSYSYDPLNRVQSIMDALGSKTEFAYDPMGRIKQVKDANGHATSYAYDKLGRLTNVINALNQTTSYFYDAVHNLIAKTDANGHNTQYEYDPLHQLTKETDSLGRTTELFYDSVGNVTGMKSPDQTTTRYSYDLMSRLTGIQYEDGKQVSYAYDQLGRRTSMTDSIGISSYQYDVLNRLTQVTDPYNQTIQYEWTPTGQRKKMIYPDQSIVTYDVDLLDRITGVTDASGGHTSYTYDVRGLLISKVLPTQAVSTYQYDAVGQLQQIRHANQNGKVLEQLTYAYDPAGNRTRMERLQDDDDEDDEQGVPSTGETIVTQYAYDALNQLVQVQQQNGADASSLINTSYSYDQAGNRISKGMAWGDLSSTELYTYNGANQLTHWQSETSYKDYTYDLRGNLLNVAGIDANEAQSSDDEANPAPGEEWLEQFVWDSANRLTKQINPEGDITQYTYDGDGNRMGMTIDLAHGPDGRNSGNGNGNHGNGNNGNGNNSGNDNGNGNGNGNSGSKCDNVVPAGFVPPGLAKKCGQADDYPSEHPVSPRDGWEFAYKQKHREFIFTNDVSLALPEPIAVQQTDESMWKETYTYGAVGERLSMTYRHTLDANNGWEPTPGERPDNATVVGPNTLYYLTDALGSAIGMLASNGKISSRYHYDEFGIPMDAKKFDPNWPGPDNLYGYTGLGYDFNSGLTYARARYYKPELGRFISEDTYKGSLWNPHSQNLYGYVENNPLIFTDPSGHKLVKDTNQIAYLENLAYCLNPNDGDAIWATSQLEQRLYYYDDEGDRYKMIAAVDSVFDLTPEQAWALWNSPDVTPLETAQLTLYFGKQTLGALLGTARIGASGSTVRVAATAEAETTSAIQTYWPPNRGFWGTPITETLQPGTLIDRYGYPGGTFVSPRGTPFGARALPADTINKPYNVYEVVTPVEVQAGQAAPWFGQPGFGTQYEFSKTIQELLDSGVLRQVDIGGR